MPFISEQTQIEGTRIIGGGKKKKKKKNLNSLKQTHLKIHYFRKNTIASVQF